MNKINEDLNPDLNPDLNINLKQSLKQEQLEAYLKTLLNTDGFKDYCPNGLQVKQNSGVVIDKIISGVTINQALIEQAIDEKAQAILVHHGLFWKGDKQEVQGLLHQRLRSLLLHDIALFAYHLPLDAHPIYGNNVELGRLFDFSVDQTFGEQNLIHMHNAQTPMPCAELLKRIQNGLATQNLANPPLQYLDEFGHIYIDANINSNFNIENIFNNKTFSKIAWCSGGAQSYFADAIAAGADVFITGEISEQYVHLAQEAKVAYIVAGHHATERYGVQALGQHLANQFNIEHKYIDILSMV